MASSTCPAVVGKQHCYEKEMKLEMKEECMVNYGGFVIKDISGMELFQVHIRFIVRVQKINARLSYLYTSYHVINNSINRK